MKNRPDQASNDDHGPRSSIDAVASGIDVDDVAELRRRVAELERENDALTRAVRARDDFIAIAGHELRNPMNAVALHAGHLALLADQLGWPAQASQQLGALQRHTRTFIRRATTLLDVSRIASGVIPLEREPLDLGEVIGEVVAEWAVPADLARAPLQLTREGNLTGEWDRVALEQVASNLVSNAIKFGAGKPVHLRCEGNGGQVRLSVRDQGPGISPADAARIFEPFERAVTQRQHGGFGLGLWIARQLVAVHGGTIDVAGDPARGSTFTVSLPRGLGSVETRGTP